MRSDFAVLKTNQEVSNVGGAIAKKRAVSRILRTEFSMIQAIINSRVQTLYAQRTLKAHGMVNASLQTIYHFVIIAKLTNAFSAWWGFTSATDRQKIDAIIRRSQRNRLAPPNHSIVSANGGRFGHSIYIYIYTV